ncbi:MAG: AIR synthase related protein, partial [Myxococcota bacterium]
IAALSDLSAMGAAARALLSSLVLPKDFADDDFDALTSGVFEAADEAGAVVAGGNLAAGSAVSIHTTVIGTCEEPVRRAGASAGERLYLSGRPADASLGLACLLRRDSGKALPTGADVFIERWRRPTMHRLPSGATAAIDLSDGLASDVRQLARASRVDCELERASLEGLMGSDFLRVCDQIDADPLETLLQGGESYVLAYAAPDGAESPEHTAIGTFTAGEGKLLLEGQAIAGGFDHFAQSD